jgi:hypothetical protein
MMHRARGGRRELRLVEREVRSDDPSPRDDEDPAASSSGLVGLALGVAGAAAGAMVIVGLLLGWF